MDKARHDADLAFARCDDAGAIGADKATTEISQRRFDPDHVIDGNAFRDAHDQVHAGIGGLEDGVRSKWRRHVDHADVGARFGDGVTNRVEYRYAEVFLATAPRRHAGDNLRAILDALFGVEGSLVAGDALANDLAVFVY